jgi:hypothetical protein
MVRVRVGIGLQLERLLPSMLGRNLQCQPERGVNLREECHGYTHGSASSGAKA